MQALHERDPEHEVAEAGVEAEQAEEAAEPEAGAVVEQAEEAAEPEAGAEVEQAEGEISITPVPAYNMSYTLDGKVYTQLIHGEHKTVGNLDFVRMEGRPMAQWVHSVTGFEKRGQHGKYARALSQLPGFKAIEEARQKKCLSKACGWDTGCRRVASPSFFIYKQMIQKGSAVELAPDEHFAVKVGDISVRVLPRLQADSKLWVAANDLLLFCKIIKEYGMPAGDEAKLPPGIRKRKNAAGHDTFQVKKLREGKHSFITCKSLEEAIDAANRE